VVFEVCGWSSWLLHHVHIVDQGCTKPGQYVTQSTEFC